MNAAAFYRHRWTLIRLPLAVAALVLGAVVWLWLYPMPPTQLRISTGLADGAYQVHAERYRVALARRGVQLEIQASAGSEQNLQRLQSVSRQADLGLVQGGYGWSSYADGAGMRSTVQTLASVDIEALWLFVREGQTITALSQLAAQRVAAGPEGSGHRAMLRRLLAQQGVAPQDLRWLPLSGLAARDALVRGAVDAVFMVASPGAPGISALLSSPGVRLVALQRTAAIAERNNYLESRLLPQDGLGLRQPPRDTPMLSTATHLLVRQDLDPALKRLATAVAQEVHDQAGVFHRQGEFPSLRNSDFPTAPEARDVLGNGLDGLEGWLPFWWAQVLQRLLIIGLPLAVFTALLWKLVPAWLRWHLESRVSRWYGELKFIENDLATPSLDVGGLALSRINRRLRKIEHALGTVQLPPELAERWYVLRHHVEFVRERVGDLRGR
jgi:TRAP-type uncharacterized transport system substrate-binding protein